MFKQTSIILVVVVTMFGCQNLETSPDEEPQAEQAPKKNVQDTNAEHGVDLSAFKALPAHMNLKADAFTALRVDLGRRLYFDKRLSKNHDISCNSCHGLDTFGVDGEQFSLGHKKQRGGRNSPSVYNAAGHLAQFWDGRAPSVEEQAKGPVLNPVEMAMASEGAVLKVLKSIPGYVKAFKAAFPNDAHGGLSYDNMGVAIGAFERKLLTPSPWDKYIEGQADALTDTQKKGLRDFLETGCHACHNGAYMGGSSYQKLGALTPWPNQADQGRFGLSKNPADKMMFKVASLRNVAKTAPYFHDGSVKELSEAVRLMAEHQLGQKLSAEKNARIVSFLNALTGELPQNYIKEPQPFPGTKKTPRPDPT